MEIYLMRHGEPFRPAEWDGPEPSRPLTERGKEHISAAVEGMRRSGFRPQVVLSSPLPRAKETADIVSRVQEGIEPICKPELTSGVHGRVIKQVLLDFKDKDSILVVGHMPDLPLFAARLVPDPALLEAGMKPGEIMAVRVPSLDGGWGEGELLWRKTLQDWK